MAFCGVLVISPPQCLSKENRFEGESHWGRSDVGGSLGSSVPSAAAKTIQPEGVVEVVEKVYVAFSSSDQ